MTEDLLSSPVANDAGDRPARLAETIFESLNEGITVADCSLPDMPLVYVNRAFERVTGYAPDEVIGRNCRFLHGTERDQPGLEHLRECLRKGTSCTVVLRNFKKDGSLFYNELHLSPIRNARGDITYFIGIQRDVTERVNAEESLWKLNDDLILVNKNLNEANQRLNELLYVAAHDLKSPLTSIMLSLEILHEKWGRMPGAAERRQLRQLQNTARHMRDIVVDVLEARRVESDGVDLELQPIDLVLKATIVLRFYRDLAAAKRLSLKLIAPKRLPRIRADRNCTLSVIDNLLSNAIKYSPPRGRIVVRLSKQGRRVRLEVEDQGQGIGSEEMPKLFGRFVRLSAQPTGGEHSTGLGLFIVRKYVELMKGRVWAESEPGKGARFIVELPAAKHS